MSKMCDEKGKSCSGRRKFLVSAGVIAGGLVLNLANAGEATASPRATETTIKLDESSPLNKVGGSQVVDFAGSKVIVARTSETTFAVASAVCTHKGATLKYDDKAKQFACPSHGSKFGLDGSNAGGPAKTPLKTFKSQTALLLIGD
jgi:Rieske Fe-S protein